MGIIKAIFLLIRGLLAFRLSLAADNLALRQQVPVCLLVLLLAVPCLARTRVALIDSQGGSEAGDVLALAEAQLFDNKDICLVERSRIERLLSEAERSLSGLTDGATAIRVGKILGADVLAVVETEPQSHHALGLLVFETVTGMHLWDASLPEADPQQAARQIVQGLQQAVRKRSRAAGLRRSICLASVRNADLPPAANAFGDGVGRLLERMLTKSPEIIVLERRRLELITREITLDQLGESAAEMDLLASLTTADLEIRRDQGGGVRATVSLHAHSGKLLGRATARADTADTVGLAEALTKPLAEALQATPVVAGIDRQREAARFAQEALWLCQHRQLGRALTAVDVALALTPDSAAILDPAMQVFFFAASEMIDPGRFGMAPRPIHASLQSVGDSLSHAERGMTVAELLLRKEQKSANLQLQAFLTAAVNEDGSYRIQESPAGLAYLETCFQRLLIVEDEHSDQTHARLASLQQRYRALCKVVNERARRAVRDRQTFIQYTNCLSVLLRNVELYAPTGKIWADDTADFLEAWLEPAARHGVYWNEFFTLSLMFAAIGNHAAQCDRVGQVGQWVLVPADLERLLAVYRNMTRHPEPAIAVLGHACRLIAYLSARRPLRADAMGAFRDFLARAQAVIRDPAPGDAATTRAICYYAILDAIEALPATEDRRRQFEELAEFMLLTP